MEDWGIESNNMEMKRIKENEMKKSDYYENYN